MSYLKLTKRATNGKLLKYANFEDGSFVNLIEMRQPYKNGLRYVVYETTKSPFCSNGIFTTLDKAIAKYELMVNNGSYESKLMVRGNTKYYHLAETQSAIMKAIEENTSTN